MFIEIILLHQDLSYRIRGVLYKIHNELGQYRNEKQYGDAIPRYFIQENIPFLREAVLLIGFTTEQSGRNGVDFIVDKKIILELKVIPGFSRGDYGQCL